MVTCYPQPGKAKSLEILKAFASGCGGAIATEYTRNGTAAFFGLVGIEGLLFPDYFYGDNAYFDRCRNGFFRFTKNAFQPSVIGKPDYKRLKDLRIKPSPWKRGKSVVVVEQSAHFLKLCGQDGWLDRTLASLKTDRPVVVRKWPRDKTKASVSLQADLRDAHMLVTHMSCAAVESVIAGVPVMVTGECAASPMASHDIESPVYPDRDEWLAWLANNQWTLEEIRSGTAWRSLNDA